MNIRIVTVFENCYSKYQGKWPKEGITGQTKPFRIIGALKIWE